MDAENPSRRWWSEPVLGGAVAALRLGQAGIETAVMERGRRGPIAASGDIFCTYS